MPGVKTQAELVTLVRQRCDNVNTTFVTDAEIQTYLEGSLGELLDLVIEEGGADHFLAVTPTISTVAGTEEYTIYSNDDPSTVAPIYKVVAVEAQFGGKWRRLANYAFWQRLSLEDTSGWSNEHSTFYRINFQFLGGTSASARPGAKIRFIPTPQAVHSVRVVYIQYPGDWSNGDFTGLQSYSGWSEMIVCDAAAKILEKEESDSSHLLARKAVAMDRIRHHARTMNHGEGDSIRDMYESYQIDHLPWRTS